MTGTAEEESQVAEWPKYDYEVIVGRPQSDTQIPEAADNGY